MAALRQLCSPVGRRPLRQLFRQPVEWYRVQQSHHLCHHIGKDLGIWIWIPRTRQWVFNWEVQSIGLDLQPDMRMIQSGGVDCYIDS